MQPVVVVMTYEPADGFFELSGQVVMIQLHDILHRAMIALDLALSLWMIGRSTSMLHLLVLEIRFQLPRHVAGTIV